MGFSQKITIMRAQVSEHEVLRMSDFELHANSFATVTCNYSNKTLRGGSQITFAVLGGWVVKNLEKIANSTV